MADSCLLDGSTSPFFGSDLTRRFHYHTAIILAFRLFLRPSKTNLFNKYPFPVITRNLIYIRRLNHRLLDRCVLRHTSNMNFQSWVILGCRGRMIFFQIREYIVVTIHLKPKSFKTQCFSSSYLKKMYKSKMTMEY